MDDQIEKYHEGLNKLKNTQNMIHNYHLKLSEKGPELESRLDHIQRIVSEIEEEFVRIKTKREDMKEEAFEVEGKTNEAK